MMNRKISKIMIRAVFLLLIIAVTNFSYAQNNKLPPFRMMQVNNHVFSAQQLPMGKAIILVYFTPGCEHCEKLTGDMLKHIKELANTSVAMITYRSVADVAGFVKQFNLQKYPNIYVGTEGNSFFLQKYYRLEKLPFLALYTKNGDLVKKYTSETGWGDLLKQLKNLK